MLALAEKHDMVGFPRLFYKSSKLIHPKSYIYYSAATPTGPVGRKLTNRNAN